MSSVLLLFIKYKKKQESSVYNDIKTQKRRKLPINKISKLFSVVQKPIPRRATHPVGFGVCQWGGFKIFKCFHHSGKEALVFREIEINK